MQAVAQATQQLGDEGMTHVVAQPFERHGHRARAPARPQATVPCHVNQYKLSMSDRPLEVRGYSITELGRLLIRQIGAEVEDAG